MAAPWAARMRAGMQASLILRTDAALCTQVPSTLDFLYNNLFDRHQEGSEGNILQ